MRKLGIGLAVFATLALVTTFVFQRSIGDWLFKRAIESNVSRDSVAGRTESRQMSLFFPPA